jgi:Flp pilus assembly pilin Flp
MGKLKKFASELWADESGQGMLEYVLLVVAIVFVLAIFKKRIGEWFGNTATAIDGKVSEINN